MNTRSISWMLFVAGFLLAAIGFVVNSMWRELPLDAVAQMLGVALGCLLIAWIVKRLLRCTLATAAATVWLFALVYYTGWSALAAVSLVAVAALALGSMLVRGDMEARAPLSILVGLALLCGLDGWLLPYPIHYQATYLVVLLLVIALRWRAVVELIRPVSMSWRSAVNAAPAAAVLTVMVLGSVSMFAWAPTIHNDDLAYHLGLPTQLQHLGYYTMAARSDVWAVSAWAADVLQGIVRLLSDTDARGSVDMLWLLLAACLMWKLGRQLGMRPWLCWMLVALYASLPTTASTLGGMQTEGPTTAVIVGLALLIEGSPRATRRLLLIVAILFGMLLSLKVINLTAAGPLGLWLLWKWRKSLSWRVVPLALLAFLVIGGSSYFFAYVLTGNPVLPVFNQLFHSTYYHFGKFDNTTWDTGLHWNICWNMVFHTSKYQEGYDGAAGFVLIALLGALVAALLDRRTRPLALAGVVAFALPLTQTQYLRYATPALGLLMPAMLASTRLGDIDVRHVRAIAILLVTLLLANFAFVPNVDWQVRSGMFGELLAHGRTAVVDQLAPEVKVAQFVDDTYGDDASVLVVSQKDCFGAPFGGRALVRCWYDPELDQLSDKADSDASGGAWMHVFDYTGANLLVLRSEDETSALTTAIRNYAGQRVYTVGGVELWALHRSVAGVSVPAPPKAVMVKFDTSSALPGPTMVDADVELSCTPSKTPIVLGWVAKDAHGAQVAQYHWATCKHSGHARDVVQMKVLGKLMALTVSAAPAYGQDLGLVLDSADASWRKDLIATRDLGRQWRNNPIVVIKKWNRARLAARRVSP